MNNTKTIKNPVFVYNYTYRTVHIFINKESAWGYINSTSPYDGGVKRIVSKWWVHYRYMNRKYYYISFIYFNNFMYFNKFSTKKSEIEFILY